MTALGQTLSRVERGGELAARTLGKPIYFSVSGHDVRIDKSLADAVMDPLLHIVRNAVSHGIEPLSRRRESGKPDEGYIAIEAFSEGSRVRIRIKDDGQGIDPELVARAAIDRGLLQPGTELSRNESLRLIFRPGFSTADSVSTVSGRGVGLDAVEKAVEQLGGELRVSSEPGAGSVFEIVLPTTLAVVPSLIVNSGPYKYALGVGSIVEAGHVKPDELESDADGLFLKWRELRLPVVRLRELLGDSSEAAEEPPKRYHIVVSHSVETEISRDNAGAEAGAAVIVDSWQGHDEVLVRSLGRHGSRWRGVSGASTLGDGSTALVLDLPRLIKLNESEREW
jgi:two-component system chemotaxis sensor kinase CheA